MGPCIYQLIVAEVLESVHLWESSRAIDVLLRLIKFNEDLNQRLDREKCGRKEQLAWLIHSALLQGVLATVVGTKSSVGLKLLGDDLACAPLFPFLSDECCSNWRKMLGFASHFFLSCKSICVRATGNLYIVSLFEKWGKKAAEI